MTGLSQGLIYQVKPGKTTVGSLDGTKPADIRLSGENIQEEHCYFENSEENGTVHLHALPQGITMVNGRRLEPQKVCEPAIRRVATEKGTAVQVTQVWLPYHHWRMAHLPLQVSLVQSALIRHLDRRSSNPVEAQKARDRVRSSLVPESVRSPQVDSDHGSPRRPSSPIESAADGADWSYARREAVVARLNGTDVDLETLGDQDLNRQVLALSLSTNQRL